MLRKSAKVTEYKICYVQSERLCGFLYVMTNQIEFNNTRYRKNRNRFKGDAVKMNRAEKRRALKSINTPKKFTDTLSETLDFQRR